MTGCKDLRWLCTELDKLFETDDVCIEDVEAAMKAYDPCKNKDWQKYVFYNPCKYTRNLVDGENGKYNLMLLGWSEGQGSSIHDHRGSHCIMKVVHGTVTESLFDWPDESLDHQVMEPRKENRYQTNSVAYIHDKIGLHRVSNPSHSQPAVSLHLYCPPINECSLFDQTSGRRRYSGKIAFYSKQGQRNHPGASATSCTHKA